MNWRKRHKLLNVWIWEIKAWLMDNPGSFKEFDSEYRKVEIISYRKSLCDMDNLIGGMKPLIDSLIYNNLIVDDNPKCLYLEVKQEKDPRNIRTEIFISQS